MTTWTLVTGASAGIGRELADVSAAAGRDLILLARSAGRLEALADELRRRYGVSVEVLPKDLAGAGAAREVKDETDARELEVDTLVNNAGFGYLGAFHEADVDNQLQMIRVNVTALTHLSRLYLPKMVERGRGTILNVASTAAFQPGPYMAVYYATKAYVLSFSEAITEELKGTGVSVTAYCPGFTRTEFQARAGMETSPLTRLAVQDARSVAESAYRAMERGQAVAIPGVVNRLLALSVRVSPRVVVRKVTSFLNRSND